MINKKPFSSIKYLLACLNPLSRIIRASEDLSDLVFYAYKRDVIGRSIFKTGYYDKSISEWLKSKFNTHSSGVFVDVGANIGYYTCLFSKILGNNGIVLSFEPEPENMDLLSANIKANNLANVIAIPLALGAERGVIELNIYKASNRGRHSVVSDVNCRQKLKVNVARLDDVVKEHLNPEDRISCMKIDVEGFEYEVLMGGARTLEKVDYLIIEYAPYLLLKSENGASKLVGMLSNYFQKFYTVNGNSIQELKIEELLTLDYSIDLICERNM